MKKKSDDLFATFNELKVDGIGRITYFKVVSDLTLSPSEFVPLSKALFSYSNPRKKETSEGFSPSELNTPIK